MIVVVFQIGASNSTIEVVAMATLLLAAATLIMIVLSQLVMFWRYRRLAAVDPADDLATATARLLLSVGLYGRPRRTRLGWDDFDRERIRRGIPPLRIVVEDTLREPLAAIARPDHLVEPEQLLPGKAGIAHTIWIALGGAAAAWFLYNGSLFMGGLLGVWVLIGLRQYAAVVGSVPIVEGRLPVAGPGYVALPNGKQMTVDDTALIITSGQRRRSAGALLIGPAGTLGWKYLRLDDSQFVRLWQRWAHPHPRLDLASA
jgi:hypothetical protein